MAYFHLMKFRTEPNRTLSNYQLNEFRTNAVLHHVAKSQLRNQLQNGAEEWVREWCVGDVARRAGNWFFKNEKDMLKFKLVWG